MVYNITAEETEPAVTNHINGSTEELLARFAISELCKGWPVYRDASEWQNFRSIFTAEGAHVWTTWSGGLPIDDFIKVSKEGRARGDFIMHRENGTLVNLNLSAGRAIGKMKTTITQRFTLPGQPAFDVDCDNRFIFFVRRDPATSSGGDWKVQYYKVFYEKSTVVPVDGRHVPEFAEEELRKYPEGYKYLAVAQRMAGHRVLNELPTMDNEGFYRLYDAMAAWLRGEEVDLNWETRYE